jgi:hypothetical protein
MISPDRYKSSIGFTDMLLNLLVGFVFLFIIAFILINPITKKSDIPAKAEYLFILEWDNMLSDDIDLWIEDPNGVKVSFMNKEGGLLNLEKDDLGTTNDSYVDADGNTQIVRINREVTTMRGIQQGTYTVFAHVYSRSTKGVFDTETQKWTVVPLDYAPLWFTLLRVNPYKEVYRAEYRYISRRQEIPLIQFDLDAEGNASNFRMPSTSIVTGGRVSPSTLADTFVSGGTNTGRASTPRAGVHPPLPAGAAGGG